MRNETPHVDYFVRLACEPCSETMKLVRVAGIVPPAVDPRLVHDSDQRVCSVEPSAAGRIVQA